MQKKYLPAINEIIAKEILRFPNAVFYGENIDNGSCISGLTRNFKVLDGSMLINIGNCEYTHCGMGFGMMINGITAVLFVKQLDFMLLGIDHFVSTYQSIVCQRVSNTLGSFTIVAVAYDQGFQGPQSSFNSLGDICSIARIPGYTLTNNQDSMNVLHTQLGKPGFRFIVLNQRHASNDLLELELVRVSKDSAIFQYTEGSDATIVCFNFSTPEGVCLNNKLRERGFTASVFSVNNVFPHDWTYIKESVARTGRLVVLDDSKSINLPGYTLLHEVAKSYPESQRVILKREDKIDYGVSPENFIIDYNDVIDNFFNKSFRAEQSAAVVSSL